MRLWLWVDFFCVHIVVSWHRVFLCLCTGLACAFVVCDVVFVSFLLECWRQGFVCDVMLHHFCFLLSVLLGMWCFVAVALLKYLNFKLLIFNLGCFTLYHCIWLHLRSALRFEWNYINNIWMFWQYGLYFISKTILQYKNTNANSVSIALKRIKRKILRSNINVCISTKYDN